jgi:hypothetical protein
VVRYAIRSFRRHGAAVFRSENEAKVECNTMVEQTESYREYNWQKEEMQS